MILREDVIGIIIKCPTDNKNRNAQIDYVTAIESECVTCGSHGSVTLDVTCSCGKDHEVELSGW